MTEAQCGTIFLFLACLIIAFSGFMVMLKLLGGGFRDKIELHELEPEIDEEGEDDKEPKDEK